MPSSCLLVLATGPRPWQHARMVFAKHFASLGLTGLLAVPFALAACSGVSNINEACEDNGKACGKSDAEIAECKSASAEAETLSTNIGCRTKYDAFVSCIVDHYETPTAAECTSSSGGSKATENACEAQSKDVASCFTIACSKTPSSCVQ